MKSSTSQEAVEAAVALRRGYLHAFAKAEDVAAIIQSAIDKSHAPEQENYVEWLRGCYERLKADYDKLRAESRAIETASEEAPRRADTAEWSAGQKFIMSIPT